MLSTVATQGSMTVLVDGIMTRLDDLCTEICALRDRVESLEASVASATAKTTAASRPAATTAPTTSAAVPAQSSPAKTAR